jgi:L-2,4-diaminobutyrate decarboxylase
VKDLLTDAFDPQAFRRDGHAVVDLLADYLARARTGTEASGAAAPGAPMPVLPWRPPGAMVEAWAEGFPRALDAPAAYSLPGLLARVVAESNHLHHPGYVGHQVTPPLPSAALCDLVAALLNNGMAVYEMGPVGVAIERLLVRFLASTLGMSVAEAGATSGGAGGANADGADGIFTSGGSAGNLTALLAARQAGAGFDVWTRGAAQGPPLAFLCSSQAHYSVSRALQIMGLGAEAAWPVPVDDRFRLQPAALPQARRAAEAAGRRVIGVVASAGATATGSFDPLDAIADFAAGAGLWLHVDGAHGAAVALSPRYRHLVRGIERADSVVWDAHKLMLMPALVTAVIFRDGRRSYQAFAQEASYLFADVTPEEQWFNYAGRTLECTKLMMSLKLYATLTIQGPQLLAQYLERQMEQAAAFADLLAEADDFELAVRPECNIVCFRYRPAGLDEGEALDRLQAQLRQRIIGAGSFYLVQTRLPRGLYLRVTLLNAATTLDHLQALLATIRAHAR